MKTGTNNAFLVLGLAMVCSLGCNEDMEQEPCPVATVEAHSTPEDSLGFGRWEWAYTIKWSWSWLQEEWEIVDSIYPGEQESGFEILDYVYGSVDSAEICFNINGVIASGCYHLRNSHLSQTSVGPSDSVVSCRFFDWEEPNYGGILVDVYFPEAPNETIEAQLSGLWMFYVADEQAAGVRYRNRFIKVE